MDLPAARLMVEEMLREETNRQKHVRLTQLRMALGETAGPDRTEPPPPSVQLPLAVSS